LWEFRLMNSLRKLLGFAASAAMLAAFALPASATGTKQILFSGSPSQLQSTTTQITVTITNKGSSNANSFAVEWPTSAALTVSPVATATFATGGSSTGSCTVGAAGPVLRNPGGDYSRCVFNNQIPLKVNKLVTITLYVTVTNNACTTLGDLIWKAYAWTGAPGPASTSFSLLGSYTTSFPPAAGCSITFVEEPEDAFIGWTITGDPFNSTSNDLVSVKLEPVPAVGTPVTVSAPECGIEGSGETDEEGVATFTPLSTATETTLNCQLEASSDPYPPATSQLFDVVLPAVGELDCSSANTFGATVEGGVEVSGTRLENVDDSGCPAAIPYIVSTDCPVGVEITETTTCTNFTYDPLGQGAANLAFTFHWVWPLEAIPPLGISAIKNTQQLFVNGSGVFDLDLCPEIIPEFEDGIFVGLSDLSPLPIDQESTGDNPPPGIQAGCLVRRTVEQVGDQIQITEDAYLQGDWGANRQ
jgi:hypothetical protein